MRHDSEPEHVTAGAVDHGPETGQAGGAWWVAETHGAAASRGGRPGAAAVLDQEGVKVVAFEFAPGDVLAHHAARHPVLIQAVSGHARLTLPDTTVDLFPGRLVHLTAMVPHKVTAQDATTLTVTMLLPRASDAQHADAAAVGHDR